MKTEQFEKTKSFINVELIQILSEIEKRTTINNQNNTISEMYCFNKLLINHIQNITERTYNCEVNQTNNYSESDFYFTSTIFNLHSKNGFQKIKSEIQNSKEGKLETLKEQIKYLLFVNEEFPENIGANVTLPIKNISEVPLDLYQIIHLSILHTKKKLLNSKNKLYSAQLIN